MILDEHGNNLTAKPVQVNMTLNGGMEDKTEANLINEINHLAAFKAKNHTLPNFVVRALDIALAAYLEMLTQHRQTQDSK